MALPPQIRDPRKLCACVRAKYYQVLDTGKEKGFKITTIETIRDPERQRHYVSIGASRTMKSYHLPQVPYGLALAFDVVPEAYLREPKWNPKGELWGVLAKAGKAAGLLWGGDWKSFVDQPHFYQEECSCEEL